MLTLVNAAKEIVEAVVEREDWGMVLEEAEMDPVNPKNPTALEDEEGSAPPKGSTTEDGEVSCTERVDSPSRREEAGEQTSVQPQATRRA
ncbi:unnamed protein product [Arabis nemorensis]|uniref:Uncharacterized protein n=1 Tax=Arabis nemorensis TaxID=586526 RepID=A0A565BUE5_9BRAS|nr:unnamed protein product [Arabis nemorensis]